MKNIPNNLRLYRTQKGLTQKQVATYLGFRSSDRISEWENGLGYPHVRSFVKLLTLYGVHGEEVYNNE